MVCSRDTSQSRSRPRLDACSRRLRAHAGLHRDRLRRIDLGRRIASRSRRIGLSDCGSMRPLQKSAVTSAATAMFLLAHPTMQVQTHSYTGSRMNRRIFALALAMFATIAAGCGYHTLGAATHLPPDVKTLAVPVFATHTEASGAETAMT